MIKTRGGNSSNKDKIENERNNSNNDKIAENEQSKNPLPNTATSIFDLMLAGAGLVLASLILFMIGRKKQRV